MNLSEKIEHSVRKLPYDLQEEVRQELWVQILSGQLHPDAISEKVHSIRRKSMVASSDRSFSFVSLSDLAGNTDLTIEDVFIKRFDDDD